MKSQYKSWKSPSLGREMELLIVGTEGTPVIIFPSAHGDLNEWVNHNCFDSLEKQIEDGFNQFFCVNTVAGECFLDEEVNPVARMKRFNQYQDYIMDELLPFISEENSNPFIIVSGVALGAYHALLMALKYPTNFHKVIGLCGYYDIRVHTNDVHDDHIYFNNPAEFIPNLNDNKILSLISTVDIRLLNYKNDPTKDQTQKMSDLLWLKFIEHEHYVWDEQTDNMWSLIPKMFKDNLF